MNSIPRNNVSPDSSKLYKSLGTLIRDYRRWHNLSQEVLAAAIGISVRTLQNWEADRHRVRINNLHDLSEFAGIPMQVCVALNAGQPLWYCLGARRFAYSAAETVTFSLDELFKQRDKTDAGTLIKTDRISTAQHISAILSCHRDIYGTEKSLAKDVLELASTVVPELNIIAFDPWGHYVGHHVCLPVRHDTYLWMKSNPPFENNFPATGISDIDVLGEGVFFCYSLFAASWNVGHFLLQATASYYAAIREQARYRIACWAATKEIKKTSEMLGMKLASLTAGAQPPQLSRGVLPVLYDIDADMLVRRYQELGILPLSLGGAPREQGRNRWEILPGNGPLIVDEQRQEACPNPCCPLQGKAGFGNVVANGAYRTKAGLLSRRFLCKECKKSFCSREGTIFYDLRSPEGTVLMALKLLIKGMPLRSVAEILQVKRDTVRHWLKIAVAEKERIDTLLRKELKVPQASLDSLWDFAESNKLRRRAALWKTSRRSPGKP